MTAARLTQEDLCLLVHRDGAWHLEGGVLAFPSLWRLRDKVGRPMADVHGPVPYYDGIGARVDRFLDRLPPDRVVWRRNLLVKPFPHLHTPWARPDLATGPKPDGRVGPDGSPYWIRSERQTLRRLPRSGAIVFTIRTQLARAAVLQGRPDRAAALAAHIRSWDDDLRGYRSATSPLFASFVDWLDRVGTPQGA